MILAKIAKWVAVCAALSGIISMAIGMAITLVSCVLYDADLLGRGIMIAFLGVFILGLSFVMARCISDSDGNLIEGAK